MKTSSLSKMRRINMTRNGSIAKDLIKSSSNSRLTSTKPHLKNSSCELKPLQCIKSTASTKNIVKTVLKPTFKRKVIKLAETPCNQSLKLLKTAEKAKSPEFPMKPNEALSMFSKDLTSYEQAEILDYTDIYYIGTKLNKINPKLEQENFGFDDSRGDLKLIKSDHISYRFEIISILGKGSFGQVCECWDYKRNEKVAMKIIRNKKRFHYQAGIEVTILNCLREKDIEDKVPVVKMKNYFLFRKHVCITFDLWGINLYEFMRSNKFQGIGLPLIARFTSQILSGLSFLKALDVIHCDLKPENILLKHLNKSEIVIIDFGSSTFYNERQHTYIQSRFYRAPEIILGIPYTTSIDMWSLGCILAELFIGKPLLPGESEHDLLVLMMELFGNPPVSMLKRGEKNSLFFENSVLKDPMIKNNVFKAPGSKKLYEVVCSSDENFLDFLSKCFEWDPSLRMTPYTALKHPWLMEKSKSTTKGNNLSYLETRTKHRSNLYN